MCIRILCRKFKYSCLYSKIIRRSKLKINLMILIRTTWRNWRTDEKLLSYDQITLIRVTPSLCHICADCRANFRSVAVWYGPAKCREMFTVSSSWSSCADATRARVTRKSEERPTGHERRKRKGKSLVVFKSAAIICGGLNECHAATCRTLPMPCNAELKRSSFISLA